MTPKVILVITKIPAAMITSWQKPNLTDNERATAGLPVASEICGLLSFCKSKQHKCRAPRFSCADKFPQ